MKKMILLALALIPASLWAQGGNYTLTAKIGEIGAPAKAYLIYNMGGKVLTDTAQLINGAFKFTGTLTEPTAASLVLDHQNEGLKKLGNKGDRLTLIIEKGKIGLNSKDSLKNAVISGSKLNEENKGFEALNQETAKKGQNLYTEFKLAPAFMQSDLTFQEEWAKRYYSMIDNMVKPLQELIKQFPDSYASLIAVVNQNNMGTEITAIEPLYKSLSERLRNSPSGLDLGKGMETEKKLSVGHITPSFTQNEVNDKPASIKAKDSNFSLSAKIGEIGAPAKAYIFYKLGDKEITDTAALVNGNFKFTGTLTEPIGASLVLDHQNEGLNKLGNKGDRLALVLEKSDIVLNATDSLKNAAITGSKLNEENKVFMELNLQTKKEQENIKAAYRSASAAMKSDQKFKDGLQARFDLIGKAHVTKQEELIKQYSDSYVSLIVVVNESNRRDDIITVEPLYNSLSERLRNSPSGLDLGKRIEASKKLSVGASAPSFTQNDVNDKPVSLADFRGKYVLIDFWASWCGPCRAENPNVVKAYQAYKDKNFTVLGVSLDQPGKKANWLAAIKADGLEWTQVSDLKYWDNAAAKLYNVKGIPQNYLLDPSGKIVGINLRGEELIEKLAELIK